MSDELDALDALLTSAASQGCCQRGELNRPPRFGVGRHPRAPVGTEQAPVLVAPVRRQSGGNSAVELIAAGMKLAAPRR